MNSREMAPEGNRQGAEFQRKKTSYFSNFALEHLTEMRILEKGGILGKENSDWRNVSEHCLAEAVGADILAEALHARRKDVVQAAILHDWYKRREVEAMEKSGAGQGYAETVSEDEKLLAECGVKPSIIKLAHSNTPESVKSEYLSHRTLEEKIIHYIDAITSGSDFVNFRDRFAVLKQKKRNVEFSESFRNRYDGKTAYEVQPELAQAEEDDFRKQIGLPPEESIISFLKTRMEERINAQK